MSKNLIIRCITLIAGLFTMAFGVALSVKASLGVSPISCIPYIYSERFPLSMGQTTMIFNVLLIVLQIAVKRKNYDPLQLIQLPVVILFGFFTDVALYLVDGLAPSTYFWQVIICLSSCVVIGFSVYLEVKAKITYLAGEGLAIAIADTFGIEFGKSKICVDCSMVMGGLISSYIFLHHLIGIREGTIIAALLVGYLARYFSKKLPFLGRWLGTEPAETTDTEQGSGLQHTVITISREFGSGGREIGRLVAQKLNLHFYDRELLQMTAEESGFTSEYIQEHEQRLANELLFSLYEQNYAYVEEQKPPLDVLFLVQSKIIREISHKEPSVIVGRCADFILKDNPNCFRVFIHADKQFREKRFVETYGARPENAGEELDRIDHDRANYCRHFTGKERGATDNYDITLDSSHFGIEKTAQLIVDAITSIR
ncbi:MAG: cytidylate kinase family protein [Opitutales bacterium]|nr:cytidylate kinase family protein [Opitutales bacterium]